MSVSQAIERAIARATIKALLDAQCTVCVYDGQETVVKMSRDPAAILGAMFSTDEDVLIARPMPESPVKSKQWVRFIYGNEGPDVINDYTVGLEEVMKPISELSDRIEAGEFEITITEKCGYPACKCIVSTSTSQPRPVCPKGLAASSNQ